MEAMTKEDRTMLPAAVVPPYQSAFVRVIAELDKRSLAHYIRVALDLLIKFVARTEPRLFDRVYRQLTPEEQAGVDAALGSADGETAPAE